jgi:hypothetical protein
MKRALFAAIGLAAAGCLGTAPPPAAKTNDVALYGPVPIIRPGTKLYEVHQAVGEPGCSMCIGTFESAISWYPNGLLICEDAIKVNWAHFKQVRGLGPNPHSPLEDACLELKLKPGMSARQVETILGPPKYGVEREPGNVELYYPEREVAVEYAEGVLVSWQRTVVYKDRERNEQGPASPGAK